MPNPSAFAETISKSLQHDLRLSVHDRDRAVAIARTVLDRDGHMMLTADEAQVVSRCLLTLIDRLHRDR